MNLQSFLPVPILSLHSGKILPKWNSKKRMTLLWLVFKGTFPISTVADISEQDFTNYLALKNYRQAILLALSMSQPKRLLTLFTSLLSNPSPDTHSGSLEVDQVLATLPPLDLVRLLKMVRDWNANARTSPIAQAVLSAILRLRTADDLVAAFEKAVVVPDLLDDSVVTEEGEEKAEEGRKRKKGETTVSLPELMDGLIPYSERHFVRLEKLVQESYMLDYIVGEMDGGVLGTEVLDLS